MLRNTIVGLQSVDRTLVEAGRGIGMSSGRVLFRVELPLAVPVIMAGVRTALVLVVGTADVRDVHQRRRPGQPDHLAASSCSASPCSVSGAILVALLALARRVGGPRPRDGRPPEGTLMLTLRRLLRPAVLAATLVTLAATAGCGLGTANGFTPSGTLDGPLKDVKGLDGLSIGVGSKNFSEQLLLGKMSVILLKSAGADVQDFSNIPGSASARQAEIAGDVGLQWEYTGTAWIEYLGHANGIPDQAKQYEAVRNEDLAENNLAWLEPAPMNNTYGFATTAETAKKLGISKLSDLKDLPVSQQTFCVESEFRSRNDGFEPMLEKYGMSRQGPAEEQHQDAGHRRDLRRDRQGRLQLRRDLHDRRPDPGAGPDGAAGRQEVLPELQRLPGVPQGDPRPSTPSSRSCSGRSPPSWTTRRCAGSTPRSTSTGRHPADVALAWLKQEGFLR